MKFNRAEFYAAIRPSIHFGHLSEDQVASYEALLTAAEDYPVTDARHLAYILATARGEVGAGLQPIAEIGKGRSHPYGKVDPATGHIYYGRGFMQLTWAKNYQVMGKRIGVDLYRQPERALERIVAAKIIVIGMMEGLFTGKKLADYINPHATDYENARRIINGTDRAAEFAGFARKYQAAIAAALLKEEPVAETPSPAPAPAPAPAPTPVPPSKPRVSAAQWIIGAVAAAITFIFGWIFMGGSH